MRWIKTSEHYLDSEDGRFKIGKFFEGGVPVYTLWELRENSWKSVLVTNSSTIAKRRADDSPNAKND